MKKIIILTIVLLIFLPLSNYAAHDIHFKGLVQSWFSYGDTDDDGKYGFNLRRVRFAPYGSLSKTVKWGFQVAWDKQKANILDAYLDFHFQESFKIKIGQFAAPGIRSGALTSSGALDLVERPMISQKWSGEMGLFGYRALGLQVYGEFMDKKMTYRVMVSNPNTSDLFNPGIKQPNYDKNGSEGLTYWGRLEFKPVKGLEIGVFGNFGEERYDKLIDDNIVETKYKHESYGGNVFYVKDSLNLKFEYVAGKRGLEGERKKFHGFYAVAGYRFGQFEPIARYGSYTPYNDYYDSEMVERYDDISFGLNYFYSKNVKLQANYVIRNETMMGNADEIDNNLFYLNFQYSFNSKNK